MGNLCYGIISLHGKGQNIVNFMNDLKGKDETYVMGNVRPLPVNMIIDKMGCFKGFEYYSEEDKNNPEIKKYIDREDNCCGENSINDNGTFDWYHWNLDHWGVKWDFDIYTTKDIKEGYKKFIDAINKDKSKLENENEEFSFCYCCQWVYPSIFLKYVSDKYNLRITGDAEEPGCELYHTFDVMPGEEFTIERYKMIDYYEQDGQDEDYIITQSVIMYDTYADFKNHISDLTDNKEKWLKIITKEIWEKEKEEQ